MVGGLCSGERQKSFSIGGVCFIKGISLYTENPIQLIVRGFKVPPPFGKSSMGFSTFELRTLLL